MSQYTFKTNLFGDIEVPVEEGLFEDYQIILGGREMKTTLYILEEFLNDKNYNIVSSFITHIPEMYDKAKKELFKCCHENKTVSFFIESGLEETDEEYLTETFGVDSVSEITPEEFIDELAVRCIRISPDKDNKIDCVFDFSLDEDETDELLVVYFDQKYEITDISHES